MTVGECPVGDDSLGLLLGDGLPLTLAGTGVGAGALTTNRESAAVTTALVGANLDLAADVSSHLTAKVTFDVVVGLNVVTQCHELIICQLVDAQVTADSGGLQGLGGAGAADSVDVGQGDLEALVARQVNSDEACHVASLSCSFDPNEVEPRRCPAWSVLVIPGNDGRCLTVRRGPGLRPGVVAQIRARWFRAGLRDVLPRCPGQCPGGLHQRVQPVRFLLCSSIVHRSHLAGGPDGGPQGPNPCIPADRRVDDLRSRRGVGSALTLLVARVVADDHHAAVATDDLALVADLLDARLNLHEILFRVTIPWREPGWCAVKRLAMSRSSLVAVDDPTASEVIGRQLNDDTVRRQDSDVVLTHLAADRGKNAVPVLEFDTEHGVGQSLNDSSLQFECSLFLGHYVPSVRYPHPLRAWLWLRTHEASS